MICIGGSSGSIEVIRDILGQLPTSFDVPIAIALHRHIDSADTLMRLLRPSGMPSIVEPYDKDVLSNGAVYLAPPDYHMLIDNNSICLSSDPPEHHARPSIDVLFESAAYAFGRDAIGIVLSGGSEDGASGAQQIYQNGGRVIVQDPSGAKVATMPQAALAKVRSAQVLDVSQIAGFLTTFLQGKGSSDEHTH